MSNLQRLSSALNKIEIAHSAEEGELNLTDDSIEITKKSKQGHEISIQIANDETSRSQPDFIVSTYDGTAFTEQRATNDIGIAITCVLDLLNN